MPSATQGGDIGQQETRRMKSGGVICPAYPSRGELVLFQRVVDRTKGGVERRAQAVHRSDDRQRDPCRNQAIFNRGSTRLIRQKFQKKTSQIGLLVRDESSAIKARP